MDSGLIIAIFTICAGVIIFIFKICFASKCEKVTLCYGLLKINREVVLEDTHYTQSPSKIKQNEIFSDIEIHDLRDVEELKQGVV